MPPDKNLTELINTLAFLRGLQGNLDLPVHLQLEVKKKANELDEYINSRKD